MVFLFFYKNWCILRFGVMWGFVIIYVFENNDKICVLYFEICNFLNILFVFMFCYKLIFNLDLFLILWCYFGYKEII